jgi:hypothetical protein
MSDLPSLSPEEQRRITQLQALIDRHSGAVAKECFEELRKLYENDRLKRRVEELERATETVESSEITCDHCGASCGTIMLTANTGHLHARISSLEAALKVEADRRQFLADTIKNCPDLEIYWNDDDCVEDLDGMMPMGFTIRINSFCAELVKVSADSFTDCIDALRSRLTGAPKEG